MGGGNRTGVQLLEDHQTQNVVVMAATKGGPAATAEVHVGDVIVKVGGESILGTTNANVVTVKCRGELERMTKLTQLQ